MLHFPDTIRLFITAESRSIRTKVVRLLGRLYPDGGNFAIRTGYWLNDGRIRTEEVNIIVEFWVDIQFYNATRLLRIIRRIQAATGQEAYCIQVNNETWILSNRSDYVQLEAELLDRKIPWI